MVSVNNVGFHRAGKNFDDDGVRHLGRTCLILRDGDHKAAFGRGRCEVLLVLKLTVQDMMARRCACNQAIVSALVSREYSPLFDICGVCLLPMAHVTQN